MRALCVALMIVTLLVGAGCTEPAPTPAPATATLPPPSATPLPPTETPVPPTPTPAPPTVDVAKVQTEAASTVVAQIAAQLTATEAARPTETPVPTSTVTPSPAPTDTPQPTAPPQPKPTAAPKFSVRIENPRYEQWGRPVDGCRRFDNGSPVRKFNMEVTLTNHTGETINDWYPTYTSNSGQDLWTCFYLYGQGAGFPAVPPGESRTVTYAAFCELSEYVSQMRIEVDGTTQRSCFTPEGQLTGCQ